MSIIQMCDMMCDPEVPVLVRFAVHASLVVVTTAPFIVCRPSIVSCLLPQVAEVLHNLSLSVDCHARMVEDGVMTIVRDLRSYGTAVATRQLLARLLLNLASSAVESREVLFRSGGVHALVTCAQVGGEAVKLTSVRGIEVRLVVCPSSHAPLS
jgi:hypothetical protein